MKTLEEVIREIEAVLKRVKEPQKGFNPNTVGLVVGKDEVAVTCMGYCLITIDSEGFSRIGGLTHTPLFITVGEDGKIVEHD